LSEILVGQLINLCDKEGQVRPLRARVSHIDKEPGREFTLKIQVPLLHVTAWVVEVIGRNEGFTSSKRLDALPGREATARRGKNPSLREWTADLVDEGSAAVD